jgi:uroporphyrinogen-III synthase
MATPLLGFTVGVTADRRWEEQAELLRRLGARVQHGATVRTLPLAHDLGVLDATLALIERPPAVLVITTAVGLRGWIAAAESHGLDEELLDALRATSLLVRGPKAAGAAITAGLEVAWRAPSEQSREVLEHLLAEGVDGRRIAVQRDGAPHHAFADSLRVAGADVVEIPVYAWTRPEDETAARRLIEATIARRIDAVTFTSSPAIWNLLAVADDDGKLGPLIDALDDDVVAACVGPVCARSAEDHGIRRVIQPRRGRLGAMVAALAAALSAGRRTFPLAGHEASLQGAALSGPSGQVLLTDRERAVMEQLVDRPGAVVSKDVLLQQAWGGLEADAHTVEVTVGRLRRRLDDVGGQLETVPRRGYRLVP